jgi:hypothetical protein
VRSSSNSTNVSCTSVPAHLDRAAGDVDPYLTGLDHLLALSLARPGRGRSSQEGAHSTPELADRKRLGDVVVRPELEPEHLVQLVVARGQHDDRNRAVGAQPLAHLEPVELRQHQVENDEVDVLLGELRERLLAVPGMDDSEPVAFERVRQKLLNGLLVVDEQDRGWIRHEPRLEATVSFPTLIRAMAPPRRARAPHARPRRGSVERPINARLVRGTWLFVALPLLLAAFTVGRPSRCRRRRCLPHSMDRPPSSWHASSPGTTRIERRDLPAASAPPTGSRSS